ncbi:ankyrin repeats (3 copies) domain-containing protein [Ditylenchus destructor]|nr:ankyrin repeats (3 copies) domain-containing protein [Ditylenchus destructor]
MRNSNLVLYYFLHLVLIQQLSSVYLDLLTESQTLPFDKYLSRTVLTDKSAVLINQYLDEVIKMDEKSHKANVSPMPSTNSFSEDELQARLYLFRELLVHANSSDDLLTENELRKAAYDAYFRLFLWNHKPNACRFTFVSDKVVQNILKLSFDLNQTKGQTGSSPRFDKQLRQLFNSALALSRLLENCVASPREKEIHYHSLSERDIIFHVVTDDWAVFYTFNVVFPGSTSTIRIFAQIVEIWKNISEEARKCNSIIHKELCDPKLSSTAVNFAIALSHSEPSGKGQDVKLKPCDKYTKIAILYNSTKEGQIVTGKRKQRNPNTKLDLSHEDLYRLKAFASIQALVGALGLENISTDRMKLARLLYWEKLIKNNIHSELISALENLTKEYSSYETSLKQTNMDEIKADAAIMTDSDDEVTWDIVTEPETPPHKVLVNTTLLRTTIEDNGTKNDNPSIGRNEENSPKSSDPKDKSVTEKQHEALFAAVKEGNLDAISKSLSQPGGINIKNQDGDTPLTLAVKIQRGDIVQALISKFGADPDLYSEYSRGANINVTNLPLTAKETPLTMAVKIPRDDIVRLLLENGANPDMPDGDGETAIILAMKHTAKPRDDIVRLLLEKKANPNLCGKDEETPLDMAVRINRKDIARILREYIAKYDNPKATSNKEVENLPRSTDPKNHKKEKVGIEKPNAALFAAINAGNEEEISKSLDSGKGGRPDSIDIKNEAGETPLTLAVRLKRDYIVRPLLTKYGADANVYGDYARGLNIESRLPLSTKETPLTMAVKIPRDDIVQLLLQNKANPDLPDGDGETPLISAIKTGRSDIVEMLLRFDANPNKFNNGKSPLDVAHELGTPYIVEVLTRAGAKSAKNL